VERRNQKKKDQNIMKANINPGSSGNHAQTSTTERQNQIPTNQ
jgi:hypothetical protein